MFKLKPRRLPATLPTMTRCAARGCTGGATPDQGPDGSVWCSNHHQLGWFGMCYGFRDADLHGKSAPGVALAIFHAEEQSRPLAALADFDGVFMRFYRYGQDMVNDPRQAVTAASMRMKLGAMGVDMSAAYRPKPPSPDRAAPAE